MVRLSSRTSPRFAFVVLLMISGALGESACGGNSGDVSVLPEEDAATDATTGDGPSSDAMLDASADGDGGISTDSTTGSDGATSDAANDVSPSDSGSDAISKDASSDAANDARPDVMILDADTDDADVDAGDFCANKADGTQCASSGRWACCSGQCRSLQTKNNCGGCGITCPDDGACLYFGTYPNIGNVCGCGNSTGCPTKQSCLVVPQQDTCDCQIDGDGCAADQTCKISVGLTIPRRYCSY